MCWAPISSPCKVTQQLEFGRNVSTACPGFQSPSKYRCGLHRGVPFSFHPKEGRGVASKPSLMPREERLFVNGKWNFYCGFCRFVFSKWTPGHYVRTQCIHTHIHMCTHVHTIHTHPHVHTHAYYTHAHTCMLYTHSHMCTHVHTVHTCTHMHTVHTQPHVHTRAYYRHMHTPPCFTHIYIPTRSCSCLPPPLPQPSPLSSIKFLSSTGSGLGVLSCPRFHL